MAAASLVPKNGAVVYGALIADYNAFTITADNAVERTDAYGTNVCSKNVGCGTNDFSITISAFALAHTTSTAPGFGAAPATGVTSTFTLDTGVSEGFTLVQSSYEISHGRMRAAVPVAIRAKNCNDGSETWAVS